MINGFPGVGKLTTAQILKKNIGARLIDNHTILNPAESTFDRDNPLWHSLYETIKRSVFEHPSRSDSPESLIFTDCLANIPEDIISFETYRNLSEQRWHELIFITLVCSEEENVRRLISPTRATLQKLSRPAILSDIRKNYSLFYPKWGASVIEIDTTSLSPEEVARLVEAKLS